MFDISEKENIIIPEHIAIIMDGNGRWAKKNGKERIEGHYEGVVSVRSVVTRALDWNIKVLTIYAFSTENWGRPKEEIDGLMELFCKTIAMEIPSLKGQRVKILFIGDRSMLNDDVKESLEFCEKETSECDRLILCVALNYGSRTEIVSACKQLAKKCIDSQLEIDEIEEEDIDNTLYTKGLPPIDLVVRTSGEQRLSNFMLWQVAYSEFYFTPVLWPDFREKEFDIAIKEYSNRVRRFGKL